MKSGSRISTRQLVNWRPARKKAENRWMSGFYAFLSEQVPWMLP